MLRRLEPVTLALIVVCCGWTLLAHLLDWGPATAGALRRQALWAGEYWRLLTATVLHHGVLHIAFNALGLLLVGTIVARELGRGVYLICLFFAAQAGWAASLFWYGNPHVWHLGISGGLLGLIGLLFAVEWAMAPSLAGFLRSRNTWLLVFCIVLGVALSVHLGTGADNTFVSHAGHAGGLAFGLLFGLAYYGRPRCRRRPLAGAAAVLLVGVLPVAYVAFPVFDATFLLYRADRAYRAGDEDAAASFYAQVLRLDEGHPKAGARLALLEDDPARLEGLRRAGDLEEASALLDAHLELAKARFESDPERALALGKAAAAIAPASAATWMDFADAARDARLAALSELGYVQAARWSALGGRKSEAWRPASRLLPLWLRRLEAPAPETATALAREAVATATLARFGLAEASGLAKEQREALEAVLAQIAIRAAEIARAHAEAPAADAADLWRSLAALFEDLANNALAESRIARYRYQSALCLWRAGQPGPPDEEVRTRFKAALLDARDYGDPEVEALARAWFEERELLPPGDLAPPDDGG